MLEGGRDHLAATGESYWQHMRFAAAVGLMAVGAGLACLIHALVPALCQGTCSRTIGQLNELFRDRNALPLIAVQASGAMTFAGLLALSAFTALVPVAAGAGGRFGLLVFALALAIPATFLLSNSELGPVTEA